MFLIVGLGNPGELYKKTRHNSGFMAADFVSSRHNFTWNHKPKFNADVASGVIDGHQVILCKPSTFMNLSGNAVLSIMSYYKIEHNKLIVIHDDIDLELGKLKCKLGGSSGGHNGLKSIDKAIGPNYHRIRIGVGRPDSKHAYIADYVLGNFSDSDLLVLYEKYDIIMQNITLLLSSE